MRSDFGTMLALIWHGNDLCVFALGSQELGNLAADREEWSSALIHWDAALRQNPEHQIAARLLEAKAQVLLELGRTFEAIKSSTAATELAPNFAAAFLTLGRAQLNFGEPGYAIHSLERAKKMDFQGEVAAAATVDLADARELQLKRMQRGEEASGTKVHLK